MSIRDFTPLSVLACECGDHERHLRDAELERMSEDLSKLPLLSEMKRRDPRRIGRHVQPKPGDPVA